MTDPDDVRYETVRGVEVPALGLGTARMTGAECERAVETALEVGYRHVDTAQMYDNEERVGRAVANADVDREEVFLVTKLLGENLAPDAVRESFAASRDRLGVDSVDLLLIHAPSSSVPVGDTIGAMNDLQREGVVEHVGVSNFSVDQLRAAEDASETPILTDQVKYHPYHGQADLLEACNEDDVLLTAYSPLARGRVADDETLAAIGDRYGKTPAQVALRWLLQQDHVAAIPKAATPAHLRENVDVFDFALDPGEMERVFDRQGGLAERLRRWVGL